MSNNVLCTTQSTVPMRERECRDGTYQWNPPVSFQGWFGVRGQDDVCVLRVGF